MKRLITLSIQLLAGSSLLAAAIARANSTFTVTLTQVGPNVVATGSGAIDLTGLMSNGPIDGGGALCPAGAVGVGPSARLDWYFGISGPTSFGPGNCVYTSTTSGDSVWLEGGGTEVLVPQGYVSGTSLSGSATFDRQTLHSLGVLPGTYTWTWDSGANSFVLKIPPGFVPGVPEPGTLSLFALGLVGLAMRRKVVAALRTS